MVALSSLLQGLVEGVRHRAHLSLDRVSGRRTSVAALLRVPDGVLDRVEDSEVSDLDKLLCGGGSRDTRGQFKFAGLGDSCARRSVRGREDEAHLDASLGAGGISGLRGRDGRRANGSELAPQLLCGGVGTVCSTDEELEGVLLLKDISSRGVRKTSDARAVDGARAGGRRRRRRAVGNCAYDDPSIGQSIN